MKTYFFLFLFLVSFSGFDVKPVPVYKNKNLAIELRINDLVQRMTLKEKILQLNQQTVGDNNNPNNLGYQKPDFPYEIGSLIYFGMDPVFRNSIQKQAIENTRLGIPILFGYDVIHGFQTSFPIPLAQGCSWNPNLVQKACSIAAREAKLSGINWTFSPMIDVARDPRWGRVSEGYGEDPYVNGVFGSASVRGYQGKNLSDPYSIASCLKHYVGYGRSEGGRDYHFSEISAQSLWETYLPPYHEGIKAGAATVMSAFNDISGIPASANSYTLREILKKRWKFKGFVVSDWGAIEQLIDQGFAKDKKEAGLKSFNAGVEMDMVDDIYGQNLPSLIQENKIPISKLDDAVKRILRIKFRLGLFDHPYTPIGDTLFLERNSRELSLELAEESTVLLKNSGKILPISRQPSKIAIIGPLAKNQEDLLGTWSAHAETKDIPSIYSSLIKEFGEKDSLFYSVGCDISGDDESGFTAAIQMAKKSDIIILCLGEKRSWTGENTSRSTISLPSIQEKLAQDLKKLGKPIILVLISGRPLELMRLEPLADAILEIWQPGISGGEGLAATLSGRVNPSGKLDITFPLSTGQIPTYYSMRQSARPNSGRYQDIPTDPLYWFGYGLSYSAFIYKPIQLSSMKIHRKEKLIARVEVNNASTFLGKETVLWYISKPSASITRPLKELKFFEKKEIHPGGTTDFLFQIEPWRDLSFPGPDGNRRLEMGDYYLMAGNQKIKFELVN